MPVDGSKTHPFDSPVAHEEGESLQTPGKSSCTITGPLQCFCIRESDDHGLEASPSDGLSAHHGIAVAVANAN